jgi:hypothetical protein
MSHKTHMHDHGESYSGIGPTKRPNKSGEPPAEVVEGRPLTKENVEQPNPRWTQEPGKRVKRVGPRARSSKEEREATVHRSTAPRYS